MRMTRPATPSSTSRQDASLVGRVRLAAAAIALFGITAGAVLGFARAPGHSAAAGPTSTLNRPADPVVLTGGDVPSLRGIATNLLVAFKYSGGWQQIPVQLDERANVDL